MVEGINVTTQRLTRKARTDRGEARLGVVRDQSLPTLCFRAKLLDFADSLSLLQY
jgi:hypothetical protein